MGRIWQQDVRSVEALNGSARGGNLRPLSPLSRFISYMCFTPLQLCHYELVGDARSPAEAPHEAVCVAWAQSSCVDNTNNTPTVQSPPQQFMQKRTVN